MAENQGEGAPSDPASISRLERSVTPAVWRYAIASKATVIIDAADYFSVMQRAMLNAQSRILLIGWDFDTRIHLAVGRRWWQKGFKRQYPSRLGSFFVWLTRHRKDLEIKILKWSFGVFKFVIRSSMWGRPVALAAAPPDRLQVRQSASGGMQPTIKRLSLSTIASQYAVVST